MFQQVCTAGIACAILLGSLSNASAQLFSLCDQHGNGPMPLERLVATNPPPLWAPSVARDPNLAAWLKTEMTAEEVARFRAQGVCVGIGCGTATWLHYRYQFTPYRPRVCITFQFGSGNQIDAIYGPDFVYYRDGDLFVAHNPPWWRSLGGYERKY